MIESTDDPPITPEPGVPPRAGEVPAAAEPDRRRLRLVVRLLLITAFLLVLVRIFVLEPYGIPTGSMRPTILEGDVLLVNKLPYTIRSLRYLPFTHIPIPYLELPGHGTLRRGDVVVFDYPVPSELAPDEGAQYVKRCAAVEGDTVQLVDGRIEVNGREVPPQWGFEERGAQRRIRIARERAFPLLRDGYPVVVPWEGYDIELDSLTAERWRRVIEGEGASVEYRNGIVFIAGLPATHYTFRRNYFFALGDNSAISKDSRYFGFVPYDNLIGRALLIYWSRDPNGGGIRWGRVGSLIR